MSFLKKRYLGVLPSELPWGNLHPSQQTTKPQTSNDGACRQGWQGQNTGPSLAAVEKHQTNERGSKHTTPKGHKPELLSVPESVTGPINEQMGIR